MTTEDPIGLADGQVVKLYRSVHDGDPKSVVLPKAFQKQSTVCVQRVYEVSGMIL